MNQVKKLSYERLMPQKLIAGPVSKIGYQSIRNSILERCSNDEILGYFGSLITLDMIFNNRLKMKEFIKEKGEKLNLPQ